MLDWTSIIQEIKSERFQALDSIAKEALAHNLETIREATQPYLDIIHNLAANLDQYKPAIGQYINTSKAYNVVNKLGKNQFVLLGPMSEEFVSEVDQLSDNKDIDCVIENELISDSDEEAVFEKSKQHKLLQDNSLLLQAWEAYINQKYDLAILGFTAILDSVLASCSGDIIHVNIEKRARIIEEKAGEIAMVETDIHEFAIITTYFDALSTFGKTAPFSDPEPEENNRHWLMHGRRNRPVTKLDCIKVLHMIYGTLKMKELADKDAMLS